MEARMASLEQRIDRIDGRLDQVDGRLRAVEQSIAAISAKLDLLTDQIVSKLPSWWQMPVVIAGTVALLTALFSGYSWLRLHGLP
jgi:uncharacterized coiled-coil protein SlyX